MAGQNKTPKNGLKIRLKEGLFCIPIYVMKVYDFTLVFIVEKAALDEIIFRRKIEDLMSI